MIINSALFLSVCQTIHNPVAHVLLTSTSPEAKSRDCGFSTSSSNSGSTTPAPEKEKTPEEIAAEEEAAKKAAEEAEQKANDALAQKDTESAVKYPATDGTGKTVVFSSFTPAYKNYTIETKSISDRYEEAQLKAGVEYDYESGKFFNLAASVNGKSDWKLKAGYDFAGGDYRRLEAADDVVRNHGVAGVFADYDVIYLVNADVAAISFDYVLKAPEFLNVRAGQNDTANNKTTGFINLDSKVDPEEALVEGALNPSLWYKDSEGLYHRIVDKKTAYKTATLVGGVVTPGAWNFKKHTDGTVYWEDCVVDGKDMFRVIAGCTYEQNCMIITEKGYLRKESDEQLLAKEHANPGDGQKAFYTAYAASANWRGTVSEAGSTRSFVSVNNDADKFEQTKEQALFNNVAYVVDHMEGITEYKVNGLNVGQVNNEFYNVKPAPGYYLEYVDVTGNGPSADDAKQVLAYKFTDDITAACDFNADFYYQLSDGRYIEKNSYNFTDEEISKAAYCKPGYAVYAGNYYKVIAKDETDGNAWHPGNYVYNGKWNLYQKNVSVAKTEACTEKPNAIADQNTVWVNVIGDGSLHDWISKLADVFEGYDPNTYNYVQSPVNGRFYRYTK